MNWNQDCFQPAVKMALARRKAHWQAASQLISRSADHRPRCHGPYPLTPQRVCRQSRSQGLVQTCTYAGRKGVHPANFSLRYFVRQRPCSFFARFTTLAMIEKRPFVRQKQCPFRPAELTFERTAANDRIGRKPDLASEPLRTAFGTTWSVFAGKCHD